jgi:hypothetical protein
MASRTCGKSPSHKNIFLACERSGGWPQTRTPELFLCLDVEFHGGDFVGGAKQALA